ncbi:glycosyltransferase family 9 protein [Geobacter sp. SVR]|uniref:glycosyltransferase family 9 protein n=1 Tax=Geobacter sp. SVR TaxID=2495594 RepID=UPI00143EFB42|nr:glycosyltransferase family 9 protein [Geobacter sp. SVR]GCF87204.1 glycosyl transferase [Geobacter sp. SVR]
MARVKQRAKSPLCGRYLIHNIFLITLIRSIDFVLNIFCYKKKSSDFNTPKSILFSNIAHMGDVLIATSVLPVIKKAFPDIKIGFLAGSWSAQIVNKHPMVDKVHIVDHWRLNRSNKNIITKLRHYLRTRSNALNEIKQERYDISIDLYYFFPNTILMLYLSGIPVRIGYTSAGFGALLTHANEWYENKSHVLEYHRDLLKQLKLDNDTLMVMQPSVSRQPDIQIPFADTCLQNKNYIIIHIGAGAAFKEWPDKYWITLLTLLERDGVQLCFTGTGLSEFNKIETIISGINGCVNLCDKLSWDAFVEVVAGAKLLIGVDSLAGHLAAAVHVPFIVIKTGITSNQWRPFGDGAVLTYPVSCAPCYLKNGCESMGCVRLVKPEDVYSEIETFLNFSG